MSKTTNKFSPEVRERGAADPAPAVSVERYWRYTEAYRRFAAWAKSVIKRSAPVALERASKPVSRALEDKAVPSGVPVRESVDICIATDCRFPGGNASSTLDELLAFKKAGLKVILLHTPLGKSRRAVAPRYADHLDSIVHVEDVQHIRARVLIIRGPRILFETAIQEWGSKIEADRCVIVVNNSAYRPSGEPVFRWEALREVTGSLPWPSVSVHPLGPAIRAEAIGEGFADLLDSSDWNPTFDATSIPFLAKRTMRRPFVIGRHGRDGAEKWLEDPEQLAAVFPDNPEVRVLILGGAGNAGKVLGKVPSSWRVFPFGGRPVAEFLHELDAFVYFPHSRLNEAFGRTIVEAMFAGVPCILPKRFEETFGDLAIYCEPHQVQSVLERLASDDSKRMEYVTEVRRVSESLYESAVLFRRLPGFPGSQGENSSIGLSENTRQFKGWVEGRD